MGLSVASTGTVEAAHAIEPSGGLLVACTLTPNDGRSRMVRWQRLHDQAKPVAHLCHGRLEVIYQAGLGIQDELVALAQAESDCCSFVAWSVTSRDGRPVLQVIAPAETPDAVMPIATLFGAGHSTTSQ